MFKRIRIAILLYILLFVALGQFLAGQRSTDWDRSLRVNVYTVNAGGTAAAQGYIDTLRQSDFSEIERFFEEQAGHYRVSLGQPVRVRLAEQLEDPPPAIPAGSGILGTMLWSLQMRWFVTRLHWSSDSPTPDVTVFAIYHDGQAGAALDRSTALRKNLTAVANVFAARSSQGGNLMIIAHELLHTLGATDKYDPATGLPSYPNGFADPSRTPRYPQDMAELMAGCIPLRDDAARQPDSLDEVMIGPVTALEIGWLRELTPDDR
jgi:hypothetical protein